MAAHPRFLFWCARSCWSLVLCFSNALLNAARGQRSLVLERYHVPMAFPLGIAPRRVRSWGRPDTLLLQKQPSVRWIDTKRSPVNNSPGIRAWEPRRVLRSASAKVVHRRVPVRSFFLSRADVEMHGKYRLFLLCHGSSMVNASSFSPQPSVRILRYPSLNIEH